MSKRPTRCAFCNKPLKYGPRSPQTKKFCSPKCRVESFWMAKMMARVTKQVA